MDRNAVILQQIRGGTWKEQDVHEFFYGKEKELQRAYEESTLPYGSADVEKEIRELLCRCLAIAYQY